MKPQQTILIDVPESLSPKLVFLRKHRLATKNTSKNHWRCTLEIPPKKGCGKTEADAIIDWCNKNNVKHYNLQ